MVTHDPYSACYARRVLFLKDGRLFNELLRGTGTGACFTTRSWTCWRCWGVTSVTLSKLSWRNAQRQARDYLVYFVTVVIRGADLRLQRAGVLPGDRRPVHPDAQPAADDRPGLPGGGGGGGVAGVLHHRLYAHPAQPGAGHLPPHRAGAPAGGPAVLPGKPGGGGRGPGPGPGGGGTCSTRCCGPWCWPCLG